MGGGDRAGLASAPIGPASTMDSFTNMSNRINEPSAAGWRMWPVAVVMLLAACASNPPAPVEHRTEPRVDARARGAAPAAVSQAAAGTAAVSAPSPAMANAPDSGPQTAPIRSAGVEVRPLDRPAEPARASALPPGMQRTAPRGVKRPSSDERLAEMRASGQASPVASGTAPPAAAGPTAAAGAAAAGAAAGQTGSGATGATSSASSAAARPDGDESRSEAKGDKSDKADTRGASATGFDWPAKGRVIQGFAEPRSMGISIAGSAGDPVNAAADGKVIFSGPGPRGYGNLLIVKHDGDTLTVYAHNRALLVKDGQSVKRGQKIAEVGDTGTDRTKLHFEVRKSGRPIDPQKLLPPR